ncbi:MAG: NAD(P)/FAD-dependent oxidoreductase [Beijerinckiaceae bacterium]
MSAWARQTQKTAAVIGGGPAGLMAADTLAQAGVKVIVYDRMPSLARKFLLAGRGGLNITHSEPFERFVERYGAAKDALRPMLEAFPPQALVEWCHALGEETFVGTSGRVFPKSFKASPLLRRWLRRLESQGVEVRLRHAFVGFDENNRPVFETPDGKRASVDADATVLALGGASWPRLGADGSWVESLRAKGVTIAPLRPANCGFDVAWSPFLREKFAGAPLKNVALTFGRTRIRGEAMIAETGLEGGGVYTLSALLRDAIEAEGFATLWFDLRPDMTHRELALRLLEAKPGQSAANVLRKAAGLSPAAAALLREPGPLPQTPDDLAKRIKGVPVHLTGVRPIARAISSAGGISFADLDANLMLKRLPGVFAAGEMLDWEAPTGGYLLQACMATGRAAGQGVVSHLKTFPE